MLRDVLEKLLNKSLAIFPARRPGVITARCYRCHIGWISWKIIARLISLTFDASIKDLFKREHAQILARIGVGCRNFGFGRTKPAISETVEDRAKVTINRLSNGSDAMCSVWRHYLH